MNNIIHGLSNEEYHDRNGKYGDYISSMHKYRSIV